MSTIVYGNLSVEIIADLGARVNRLSLRSAPPSLVPRPFRPPESGRFALLGRQEHINEAYAAIRSQRPVEFTATCGYGKSTLLRHVAANAVSDGAARSSVYLNAGPGGTDDLLQRLVTELYTAERPVKLTPDQCARLLGQVRAVIALDDVALGPDQVEYLLRLLPGCSLVLGSSRPVLGRHGSSRVLAGLPDDAAMELITSELGRQLAVGEQAAAGRLVAAVDGQPLHLRQAAALVRENGLSFQRLAETAERDPEDLDRLSVNALAVRERRALAVLALAAGALLPADVVGTMGDIAKIGESLGLLHRRGLAEQHADRFGLPVCKVGGYRQLLLKDLDLAAALRELAGWLANRDPASADSLSAAGAALSIIEWAAELGDWPAVARLARVAEPIFTLAGRWEASRHILDRGLEAARATGDRAAEALFSHQQGTLAFCQDQLDAARALLERALELREQLEDHDGAAVTRHNLQLLLPAPPPPPPPPARTALSARRALLVTGGVLVGLIVLVLGVVKAVTPHGPGHQAAATLTPSPSVGSTAPTGPGQDGTGTGTGSTGPGGTESGSTGTDGSGSNQPPLQPSVVQSADLGQVDITPGQPPATKQVTVTNPNTKPLLITGAQAGAPFSVTLDTCSTGQPIPAQGSCSITVQFAPTTLGGNTGVLTIGSAAGQSTAELTGSGFVTLTVTITGNGSGSVRDGRGIACPTQCVEQITAPGQASARLIETPDQGNVFNTWRDACAQFGKLQGCDLSQITVDTGVIADFHLG